MNFCHIRPSFTRQTSSYSPFIVTMAISGNRLRDIATYWLKDAKFLYPTCIYRPRRGDPVGISWRCLMLVKLEWLGYRMVKNLWRYVKPFWYNIPACHGQTDGRTDRIAISISRVSVLTRDKNRPRIAGVIIKNTSACFFLSTVWFHYSWS